MNKFKQLHITEGERNIRGTRVLVIDPDTKEVLDDGSNSILYAGSLNAAYKDFGIYNDKYPFSYFGNGSSFLGSSDAAIPPSYDVALFGDTTDGDFSAEGIPCFFAIGIDGVELSTQSSQRRKVDYSGWMDPDKMIAFRVVSAGNKLGAEKANMYGRTLEKGGNIYYYFKKFEQQPQLFTQWDISGDPIASAKTNGVTTSVGATDYYDNVLLGNSNESAEVVVQMRAKVTPEEVREWFNVTGRTQPNVSSIMICTAIPVYNESGNIVSYKNIQPKSKRHITRELLLDDEKGLEIIYQYLY